VKVFLQALIYLSVLSGCSTSVGDYSVESINCIVDEAFADQFANCVAIVSGCYSGQSINLIDVQAAYVSLNYLTGKG